MIFNLPNPIPYTVADQADLQEFFRRYEVIPQFGTCERSSIAFLELLRTLTDLSATFNATMRDLKNYTFGLNLEIVQGAIPGLSVESVELEEQKQVEFATWLAGVGIGMRTITKLSKRIKHHLAVGGNAYLKIKRVRVGGAVRYSMEVPFYTHCAYLRSRDEGEEFLIVSPFIGDDQQLAKYPPLILRATQMDEPLRWMSTGRGEEQAILHIKADTDEEESPYYARPDIIHCLPSLYTDYQLDNLNSKIAAAELISKILLAFQAPDPNTLDSGDDEENEFAAEINGSGKLGRKKGTPFQEAMLQLKAISTNMASHPSTMGAGAAASFAGIQYPYGDKPPTPITLEVNRDTKHQVFQTETAVRRICTALGWAAELLGMIPAKATLGGNMLRDILIQKEISTIAPDQFFFANMWNGVLAEIKEAENAPAEYASYGVKFPRVIGEILEQVKESGGVIDSSAAQAAQNTEGDQDDEDTM